MPRIDTQIQKKICILGDFSVGKTSLVERFVYDRFDNKDLKKIGVEISRKSVELGGDRMAHLLLWDLAREENFSGLQANYLRGAAGALLVCDLTRQETLSTLEAYAQQLHAIQPQAQIVIVANKYDLNKQREIDRTDLEITATKLGAPYFLTSAKTGRQVPEVFFTIASKVISQNE
jgi:small GTP-binding protein